MNGSGVQLDDPPSRSFHLWLDPGTGSGGYQGYFLIKEEQPGSLKLFNDVYVLSAQGSFGGLPITEWININRWSGEFLAVVMFAQGMVLSKEEGGCSPGARRLF